MPQPIGNPLSAFTNDFLDKKRLETDPSADTVIQAVIAEKGREEAKKIFDTLIAHIELPKEKLPPAVQEFIMTNRELPSWADSKKIKIAQELFIDHGPKFLIFLFYKSLPILYSCANGAEVLVQTGRLAHQDNGMDQFNRRIAETGQFLMDVMAPGGFTGGIPAVDTALKVRLIHASIRQFIPPEHWDNARFGKPINQEDLAVTLLTFSISILDALKQTGIKETEEKQESYLHIWKIIGHFLGVNHDVLPLELNDARGLIEKILERQSRKSAAGILLAKALIDFSAKNLPTEVLKDAPQVLLRYYSGDKIADALEVTTPYGCLLSWLPEFMQSMFRKGEKLEERSLFLKKVIDELSKQSALRMVNYFNKSKNAHFRIPDVLKSVWFRDDLGSQ